MTHKALGILAVITGLLFINGGLSKFLGYMPAPPDLPAALQRDNAALLEISWLLPLIAAAEIGGGLLLIFPKTRALGALVIFPVAVGILLTHLLVAPAGLPIALIIWGVLLGILFQNKEKYLALLQ